MKCKQCGNELLPNSLFCSFCGTHVQSEERKDNPVASSQPVQADSQATRNATYQQVQPSYQQPSQNYYQQPQQSDYQPSVQVSYQTPQMPQYQNQSQPNSYQQSQQSGYQPQQGFYQSGYQQPPYSNGYQQIPCQGRFQFNPPSPWELLKTLSDKLKINMIIWIVVACIQILLSFSFFALGDGFILMGILYIIVAIINIASAVNDYKFSNEILVRPTCILDKYEPVWRFIASIIYNILFGGIIGCAGSFYEFFGIRAYVMKYAAQFRQMEREYYENMKF